jgi:hypothetical protein
MCGGTAVTYGRAIHEVTNTEGHLTTLLIPGDQSRDWKRRFAEAERELKELLEPRTGSRSAERINNERHKLHSFYVQTYHIKDALTADAASTGVAAAVVEQAVTNDPALALLADLANLDKHGKLDKGSRSGHVPMIKGAKGTTAHTSQPETWRLDLEIEHAGRTLDGLQVADEAVRSWRQHLTGWGLL